ncbi:unnamed protein product, partial [Trichogramma brassicae]
MKDFFYFFYGDKDVFSGFALSMKILSKKGWRDSVVGTSRRLLSSISSLSKDTSCPSASMKIIEDTEQLLGVRKRTTVAWSGADDCGIRVTAPSKSSERDDPLPSLPVPNLESTMQKYLAQVEAVAPNHLEKTQSLVRAFLAGSGPKLQQRLIERQQKLANWRRVVELDIFASISREPEKERDFEQQIRSCRGICVLEYVCSVRACATDWWLNDMYLTVPLGLPINSNPGLAAKPRQISSQQDAAIFLARYINELLDYQEILDSVAVRAPDRDRITIEELAQQFLKIMEKPADAKTLPVGILTTAKRPVWGKAREELMKNERNCHNIELIETCLCIVCIDDDALPTTFNNSINETDKWLNNRDYANVLHHMLHGGGSQYFGANRCLHKRLVATYESAGIRRFRKGRVDVIRGASPEALSWVKAMCQDDPEKQRIKELFDLAVQRQTKEMTDNIMGHGIDNHLMGLRYAAVEAGEPVPEIFNDEAYKIIQHFSLSTSQ